MSNLSEREKIQALLVAANALVEQAKEIANNNYLTFTFLGETFYPNRDNYTSGDPEVWESSYSPGC